MQKFCVGCGIAFEATLDRHIWCSHKCSDKHTPKASYVCAICGETRFTTVTNLKRKASANCLKCQKGANHPNWKGGWRYWRAGHRGTDPQGLMWHTQRRYALERDKHTCQACGFTAENWVPHVHHINPYRICQSHDLSNLTCLCSACHTRFENSIKDYGYPLKPTPKHPPCRDCGSTKRKLNKRGYCQPCSPKHSDEPTRPRNPNKYCKTCKNPIRLSLKGCCSKCARLEQARRVSVMLQDFGIEQLPTLMSIPRTTLYKLRNLAIELGLMENNKRAPKKTPGRK